MRGFKFFEFSRKLKERGEHVFGEQIREDIKSLLEVEDEDKKKKKRKKPGKVPPPPEKKGKD
jgi:hypothetical protein